MKYVFLIVSLLLISCEPECNDCEECDTSLSDLQAAVVAATKGGDVVTLEGLNGDEVVFNGVVGILPVSENRSALATCPALGLPSPEYDWFCMHDDQNGRVIANDSGSPTLDDFQVYDEYPSVEYPSPMTSRVFFSTNYYPNHWGGPYQAMRGVIESWGAGWGNARENRCNSPVFADHCNQD